MHQLSTELIANCRAMHVGLEDGNRRYTRGQPGRRWNELVEYARMARKLAQKEQDYEQAKNS